MKTEKELTGKNKDGSITIDKELSEDVYYIDSKGEVSVRYDSKTETKDKN